MKRRVEVIKLYNIGKDRAKWVMSLNDFHRIVNTYNFTLDKFLGLKIGRAVWNNTLSYYSLGVNEIEKLRKTPYKLGGVHGNASQGYSSYIHITKLRSANETLIGNDLKTIESIFPGSQAIYAGYHTKTYEVTRYLSDLQRKLFDIGLSIKKAHSRVSKWAKKKNLPYHPVIKSKLEHHFAKILDELGINYTPQWPYKGYWYDFYIPDSNILIEIDGGGHSGKTDIVKNKIAQKLELRLIRLSIRDCNTLRKNYEEIKDKIRKELGLEDSM